MVDDLLRAFRRLRQNPGASAAAVVALAIGIGMNTAIYSVADALLFRPIPVPEVDRVVLLSGQERGAAHGNRPLSAVDFQEWKSSARSVESLGLTRHWEATLTGKGDPLMLEGSRVTAGFFDVMRMKPLLGRVFTAEEEVPGHEQSVVLSYNLWERQFGADPAVVGKTIELSSSKYDVAGVMPKGFTFPQPSEFWVPLALPPKAWADDGSFYLRAVARLKPGIPIESARSEFELLATHLAQRYPNSHARVTTRLDLLREMVSGDLTAQYTVMCLGSSLFLLLIACVNVASLQFARVLTRTREMAIRCAMGAPRWRLLRQVLTESVVVALAGGVLGIFLSLWCLDLLRASMPAEVERFLPSWYRLGLNGWVLFYTTLTAVAAGIVSGAGPAIWISRTPAISTQLHESGRSTGSAGRHRLRFILVAGQTAMALVLLVGASLMVKGFRAIGNPGVAADPAQLLTLRVNLPESRYPNHEAATRFQRDLLERLQGAAGVQGLALTTALPFSNAGSNKSYVFLEGRESEGGPKKITQTESISQGFFSTLGVDVKQGHAFTGSESKDTQRVAVVNETFAARYFPAQEAVGRRFHLGDDKYWTISGVCADVSYDYTQRGSNPIVYLPYQQSGWNGFDVMIKGSGDVMALLPAVRQAVRGVDALQPIALPRTYQKMIHDSVLGIGYVATILSVLAGVGVFLATLGVYSLMAWSVTERTREIGVRLALGATRTDILWMILRNGVLIIGVSLIAGVPASLGAARLLRSLLFGVSATDALTFALMPLALTLAAVLACALPARRATRTDPLIALRHE